MFKARLRGLFSHRVCISFSVVTGPSHNVVTEVSTVKTSECRVSAVIEPPHSTTFSRQTCSVDLNHNLKVSNCLTAL